MAFNKVSPAIINEFAKLLGRQFVLVNESEKNKYAHDETEDLHYMPEVVVCPATTNEVSEILKICYANNIPVTPRGAGTGLSGGALPILGGVSLSMERFNKILSIDENNQQVTVEPGVITQVLQEAVAEKKLFYPPDPASRGSCFIGGNVAENSGGPKAVKYGTVKDYVLNLEIVLPDGKVIWTGANVIKNATGYNLTQLVVGSEGTLCIVTKIVLRLIPLPEHDLLILVPFKSADDACAAVSVIFGTGIMPSALEFMERDAIDWTLKFVANINVPVDDSTKAHLLIEVDGNDKEQLLKDIEKITVALEQFETGEILFAESVQQKADLWRLRRSVAEAVKANSVYKEEDTVVPRANLPQLLNGVKLIGNKYGFRSVCYGHAGDGNLHVNIIKGDMSVEDWNTKLPNGIREIFELVISLGGTISAEHGIGLVQKYYMPIAFSEIQLQLMKSIKTLFDPKGMMNPGKIFL